MTRPNVLSLFSGIGGLDLGLQNAGMRIVGQVESEPDRRAVLRRHWPTVPHHHDTATAAEWWQERNRPHVHIVAGGPPCQPFSASGQKKGHRDVRWRWPDMARCVRVLRPTYVLLENSPALLADTRAFGSVLADLADVGMYAQWTCIPVCAFGAPHVRTRLFLVAHAYGKHGDPRMGGRAEWTLRPGRVRRGPWTSDLRGAVAAASRTDRIPDGAAKRMVAAGGDAVVPAVAQYIGECIIAAERLWQEHASEL